MKCYEAEYTDFKDGGKVTRLIGGSSLVSAARKATEVENTQDIGELTKLELTEKVILCLLLRGNKPCKVTHQCVTYDKHFNC